MPKRPDPAALAEAILAGDRVALGRGITLVESSLKEDQPLADKLLTTLQPHAGNSVRIGITGIPGVGKSTFIDGFGTALIGHGHKVAVLAVDPSSRTTRGSILGDKTRMPRLSHAQMAFIRPSPAGFSLGGVASRTREAIVLCEAAGYDRIIVETVGVGQSEVAVADMVDFFLLLLLAGAGDELQGLKKGIMEMATVVAVNKADGDNEMRALRARAEFEAALHLFPAKEDGWNPRVVTCSGLHGKGLEELYQLVEAHQAQMAESGWKRNRRAQQAGVWMEEMLTSLCMDHFYSTPPMSEKVGTYLAAVKAGELPPTVAARRLMDLYLEKRK